MIRILISLLLAGCSAGHPNSLNLEFNPGIIGGTDAVSSVARSTVLLVWSQNDGKYIHFTYCSSTLIKADVLLTAGHCVRQKDGTEHPSDWKLFAIFAQSGDVAELPPDAVPIDRTQIAIHSNKNFATKDFPDYDVAIVRLPKLAPPSYLPVALFSGEVVGQAVAAGYGRQREDDNDEIRALKQIKLTVGERDPTCPKLIRFLTSSSGAPSNGDSGGPLFFQGQLAGVDYGGGPDAGEYFTDINLVRPWIDSVLSSQNPSHN